MDPGKYTATPKTDEEFFALAREILKNSTCLKTQTAALIVDRTGRIISWGVNMCCPQGQLYGLPVPECPRTDKKTGQFYELCKPIHAEFVACINAFGISAIERRDLWHFPGFTNKLVKYRGFFEGATLYLVGHYYACAECVDFTKLIGISEIKFDDLSGGATLKKYASRNLTDRDPAAADASGHILEGIVTVRLLESESLEAFCVRNGLQLSSISPIFGESSPRVKNYFILRVPTGEEKNRAETLKADSSVEQVGFLYYRKA